MQTFDYYNWILLPLLIFLCRVGDVTLGTLRHVFISKGFKTIVPLLGFIEVLIWILGVAQVMKNLNNWACYVGFAGGFATGTYVGLIIEEKIALGLQIIRIITNQNCDNLIADLSANNHGLTIMDAQGAKGPVKVILTIVKRSNIQDVISIIYRNNPTAFYSIEDIKDKGQGVFSRSSKGVFGRLFSMSK